MTIEEIASEIRRHTYGLLNDGEVVYCVELALQSHGGIDPADVRKVKVIFEESKLDVQFILHDHVKIIDLASS